MKRVFASAALLALLCVGLWAGQPEAAFAMTPPRPAHVVIVVLENHSYSQVANEPYLTSLRAKSAVMTNTHGGHASIAAELSGTPQSVGRRTPMFAAVRGVFPGH
ncbi:hypothetical protein [Cryobacterium sp. N19]|uniref:hypothetical protein n=1 Tax=Cryobacterium sp. N19 TaxID=2048288 RepID=UPI000CE4C21A|nr:hypothetical protein [Cryobacterium sp. N19]